MCDSWGEYEVCSGGLLNGVTRRREKGTKNEKEPKREAIHLGFQNGQIFIFVPCHGSFLRVRPWGARGVVQ